MISKKVVVVVGAGASRDIGLPLGVDLKVQIADWLKLRDNDERDQILLGIQNELHSNARELTVAANRLAEALPFAHSIDSLLDNLRDDPVAVVVGKAAIVRTIARAEARSSISCAPGSRPNLGGAGDHFLNAFLRLVVQGHTVEDVKSSLSNITFVIFNYDRCIEHFCNLWLSQNFGRDMWIEVSTTVKFIHVYGSLGAYAGQESYSNDRSGLLRNPKNEITGMLRGLRIYTEQKDSLVQEDINATIKSSEAVIFLGFAFDLQNMSLFSGQESLRLASVFATTYGFSDPDQLAIKNELCVKFRKREKQVHLFNGKCLGLFSHYSRFVSYALGMHA